MIVRIVFWYRKHVSASQALNMESTAPITLTDTMDEGDQLGGATSKRPQCHGDFGIAVPENATLRAVVRLARRPTADVESFQSIERDESNGNSLLGPSLGSLRVSVRAHQIAMSSVHILHEATERFHVFNVDLPLSVLGVDYEPTTIVTVVARVH
jgi:hypothetical protein